MPPLKNLREVTKGVAAAVAAAAFDPPGGLPSGSSVTPLASFGAGGYADGSSGGGGSSAGDARGRKWGDVVEGMMYDPFGTWDVGV